MANYVQLHLLTSYPPANLNRDDLGQPKTARFGGAERLRISSQSLKRAWRTSEYFQEQLAGKMGKRTKLIGTEIVLPALLAGGIRQKQAEEWSKAIAAEFGKLKSEKGKEQEIEQLVHIAPEEEKAVRDLVAVLIAEQRAPKPEELGALLQRQTAVDIAMFGRMLASKTQFNTEAAVQVAHALGVHASAVEEDYFTAVDDLKPKGDDAEDAGAGHVGEAGFAAAVFYQYICIDRDLLLKNLGGDEELAARALRALTAAALRVAPKGKQNSFGSRAYAHFALAEKGSQQPRSLSLAFLRPVSGSDYGEEARQVLLRVRENMDSVYGKCADEHVLFDVFKGEGSEEHLLNFVAEV